MLIQQEPGDLRSGTPLQVPGEEDSGNQRGQNNLSALSAIDAVRSPSVLSVCDAAPFDSELEGRRQHEAHQGAASAHDISNFSDLPLPVDRSAADRQEEGFFERIVEGGNEQQAVLEAPSANAGGEEEEEERHEGEEDPADVAPRPRGTSRRQEDSRLRTAPDAAASAPTVPPSRGLGPERSLDLGHGDPLYGRCSFQEREEEGGRDGTDRRAPRSCNGLKRCRGVVACCCGPCCSFPCGRGASCCCCCCCREGAEEEEEDGRDEAATSHGSRKQRCRGSRRPVEVSVRLSSDGSAVVVEVPGSSSSPGLQQITLRPVPTGSSVGPEPSHPSGFTDSRRAEGEEEREHEGRSHSLGRSTRSAERQLDLSNHDATSGALMALLGRTGEGSTVQGGASCDLSRALLKACRPPPGPSA